MSKPNFKSSPTGIGTCLLLTIFLVLCLLTFSMTLLMQSKNDYEASLLHMEYQTERCVAENKAVETINKLNNSLQESNNNNKTMVSFNIDINDSQMLEVQLQLNDNHYDIIAWKTIYTKDWHPTDSQKGL